MKRVLVIIIAGCLSIYYNVWSQSDIVQFNQYFNAMGYYNPAYAGKTGDLNVRALYRLQWLGAFNNRAPKTMFVAADMPWKFGKSQSGIGIVVLSETVGMETSLYASAQYAYKKKIGKGILSVGLQAGLINYAFDGTQVYIPDSEDHQQEDEAISEVEKDAMGLDVAAGLFYSTEKYYIGIGGLHLLKPTLNLDENMDRTIERGYNFTAGYNIQMKNPLIELQPSVFVQTNLQMVSADVSMRGVYNKMYNGGIGARFSDKGMINNAILFFGATLKDFQAGYAYEFPISAISKVSVGSHELMIIYRLKLDKPKGNKNRHKSIRFL